MKRKLKKYFVPHEKNEYKPHFLRERCVLTLGIFIFMLFALAIFQYEIIKTNNFASVISSVLVNLANQDRQESDLQPLAVSPKLIQAAEMKLNDMIENEYFDHYSPSDISPWHWFEEVKYDFTYAGENLAVNFVDSEDVEKAWMASPGHRKNILNSRFAEIGIATGKGFYKGKESVFVVQMFGRSVPQPLLPPQPALPSQGEATPEPVDTEKEVVILEETPETVVFGNTFTSAVSDITSFPEEVDLAAVEKTPEPTAGSTRSYLSLAKKLVVSPKTNLFYVYVVLGSIIFLSLIFLIFIEVKRQYPRHIFYALFLILLMVSLTYIIQIHIFPEVVIK